jgi:zinc/manganese transport system permease protein
VRPARWEAWLLAVLAVATVAGARGLGSLLVVALILAPGAAALNLAVRLPAALAFAAAQAALAGVLGLLVSYHWQVAAGASVALAAIALFVVTLTFTCGRTGLGVP